MNGDKQIEPPSFVIDGTSPDAAWTQEMHLGLSEGVIAITGEGLVSFINEAARLMLRGGDTGENMHAVFGCAEGCANRGDAIDTPPCWVRRLCKSASGTQNETLTLHRTDGTTFSAVLSAGPLHVHGHAPGAVVTFHDRSLREGAQRTLVFQRSLLESQTEASVDGILVVSNQGKVLLYNRRFVFLWGVPAPLVRQGSDAALLRAVNDKIADPGEFRQRVQYLYDHPDEESHEQVNLNDGRVFDRHSAPVKASDGQRYGRVWFFRDVSDEVGAMRRAEQLAEHLSHQQRWLESLLDLLPVPVLLIDPSALHVVFSNKAADRFAGGAFPRVCLRPDGPAPANEAPIVEAFGAAAVKAAAGERLSGAQTAWHAADGHRALQLHTELLPEQHGHPALVVLAFADISELTRVQWELQQSVRVRDEFLSIASHELKTPVTALHLQLQSVLRAAARGPRPDGKDLALIKISRAETQLMRLTRLIDNLLDVSRITAGRLDFEPEEVDLAQVVRESVERLREEAARVGTPIVFNTDTPVQGFWDRLRLEQVVTNLLTNAVKYGNRHPVELRVEALPGNRARLTVQDRGIGISPENQARIFERFERAVSDRQYGGLGLGLWITRQIVTALEGEIFVQSAAGEGSVFTVELPLQPSKSVNGSDASRPAEATHPN